MRQLKLTVLGAFLFVAGAGVCGTMTGCSDSGTSEATVTAESKKADQNLQNGMKEFMKGKGKTKAPAK